MKNSEGKIVLLILSLAVWATVGWAQTSAEEEPTLTEDYQMPQQVVEWFCQAWMNEEYEEMYQALSQAGMGRMDKEKFIKTYGEYGAKGGRLIEYSLEEPITKQDAVLVKANLKFEKEIPPRIISGVHTFYIVQQEEEQEEDWGIKYIMPPIAAPAPLTSPGSSHPGG